MITVTVYTAIHCNVTPSLTSSTFGMWAYYGSIFSAIHIRWSRASLRRWTASGPPQLKEIGCRSHSPGDRERQWQIMSPRYYVSSVGRRSVHGSGGVSRSVLRRWKCSARALECMPLLTGTRQRCGWKSPVAGSGLRQGHCCARDRSKRRAGKWETWHASVRAFLGTPQTHMRPVGYHCHRSGYQLHLRGLPCSLTKQIPTVKLSSLNIPVTFHASRTTRIFKNSNVVTARDEKYQSFSSHPIFAKFWCCCVNLQAMHII
jgi:hypothetical protein